MTAEPVQIPELRASDRENLAGQDTGRPAISHTSISMQLNCLRRWGWHYDQRLETIARPRPLGMGRAFHKAIEVGDPQVGANLILETPAFEQADVDQQQVDAVTVRAGARLYLQRFGQLDMGAARELEYRVRLRSPYTGYPSQTFDLLGYADGVIDHGAHLELVEDKFVGRVDALTVRKLKLDRQVSLECYGLWRATGKPVKVVRYRYIRKPSIQQRGGRKKDKSDAETVAEFCDRIESHYADPERFDFYSHEEALFRSEEDLLLIEQELWDWAEQLRNAKRRDFFARNTSHCSDYGGCPFIPLCVGDPDARSLYRVRPPREVEEEAKEK